MVGKGRSRRAEATGDRKRGPGGCRAGARNALVGGGRELTEPVCVRAGAVGRGGAFVGGNEGVGTGS